jgi:Flp pilus assembly protein TadG
MSRSLFRRLAGDQRGVSAVEFALIAPIMIFFYFGLAEFCQGFMAQKRMGHAAAMAADLVAQQETVNRRSIEDVFDIGMVIMRPFSATPLKQRVSSITLTDGVARVDWSHGEGEGMTPRTGVVTIPEGLIAEGESLIMSEATYDYESPVDYVLEGVTQFSHTYYLRPRVVERITCSNC